jgi:glycerophosphoryl diester phosphodiesterase
MILDGLPGDRRIIFGRGGLGNDTGKAAGGDMGGKTGVWSDWQVIAHRCGGALAPENSLAGLEAAARAGLRTVEFDVMLSADGVPMLIHDETLERTTDGRGPVAQRTAAELGALSCNRGWGDRFAGEPVPTLQRALESCRRLGLLPNIEIKPFTGFERETGLVAARVAGTAWVAGGDRAAGGVGTQELPLLSSFSEVALAAAREVLPDWPAAMLFEAVPADWRTRIDALGASDLHCSRIQPGWDWLDSAREAGVPVRCYTVNDPAEAAALRRRGVVGVFSDRIDLLAPSPGR